MRNRWLALLLWLAASCPAAAQVVTQSPFSLGGAGSPAISVTAIPGWVLQGGGVYASLDLDFLNSRYYQTGINGGGLVANFVTVSRASAKRCDDSSGTWTAVAVNTLCVTNKGALIEEARTNSIRNNSMQGAVAGSPGTLPTNWAVNCSGPTRTINGVGTQNGIDYIDITFSGTTSGTFCIVFFGPSSDTEATSAYGQTWTESFFLWLNGGDFTNVTSIAVDQRSNAGAVLDTTIATPTTTPTRFSGSKTHTTAAEAAFTPSLVFGWSNGVAVNFTIRIGWPQAENNGINSTVASATVATGGATCTNGSQLFTVSGGTGTAATITGTVAANALSGALTITTAGSYTVFPPSPATLTGGGCGTPPTVNLVPTDNSAKGFATSPIRTTSAAATRAADSVTVTNPPVFGSAYTLFAKGTPNSPTGNTAGQNILQVDNGTDNQRLVLRRNSGTLLTTLVGGTGSAFAPAGTWAQSTSGKLISAVAAGDQASVFNGGTPGTAAAATLPTTPTAIDIGAHALAGAEFWNGYIERISLWPANRLPNASLIGLTQ